MATVSARLKRLAEMPTRQLRTEWHREFGHEPLPDLTRDLLMRALAYRAQERGAAGLSQAAKRALRHHAEPSGRAGAAGAIAVPALSAPPPGTRLVREWGGEVHNVLVLEDGFEYRDHRYRSLTELARLISGAHWSGPRFFGLARSRRPTASERPPRNGTGSEAGRRDGQA